MLPSERTTGDPVALGKGPGQRYGCAVRSTCENVDGNADFETALGALPSGYSEVETLQSEAHAAEQKAAALMTQVQGLQARAELARIGVKLIREEATLRADSVTPQAEKPRRGSLKR